MKFLKNITPFKKKQATKKNSNLKAETTSAAPKEAIKAVESKNNHSSRTSSYLKKTKTVLVTWSSGVIKEFSRVTWLKGKALWQSYAVVITIIVILACCFYIVSLIVGQI